MKTWGVSDSLKLYNIENWGEQYFNISPTGSLTVYPSKDKGPGIDLMRVIQDVKQRNVGMPVLLRFPDIIRNQVIALNETFRKVIQEAGYKGAYNGVYPIKVNQMREVVEEILEAGVDYDFGLEAGSKAELAAVIGLETAPDALIICNGYKDDAFIRLALMGTKLGKNVIIVVEKISELHRIIEVSREMGVVPQIGIRTKLYSRGSGKWETSGGEHAKFGLTTPELLYAVKLLKDEGMVENFKLLHFHIGSQITNIRAIKMAVNEGTRIYGKLRKMGLQIDYLDVGGGLGVDYDGSRTDFDSSINYSVTEYVADIVYTVQEICQAEGVPEPNLVSESGRFIVAHHSVLLVNAFGHIEVGYTPIGMKESDDENDVVSEMRELQKNLTRKNLLEHYHDAIQRKEEALTMFKLGLLSLEDRAKVERIFWHICKTIYRYTKELKYVPEELQDLEKELADQYLCNFSIFQSVPDHWAIQHLFPIIPIHRLDEEPTRKSTLVDITCDSDGKICKFIDLKDIRDTLPIHTLKKGEPYYLGFFLMGAYQDIMGDLHNLFGRVNEVHVFLDETEPGGYYIEEVLWGNNISEVLSWIQYSSSYLKKRVKTQIDEKVREGQIKPREGVELQNFYETLLYGYTYVDFEKSKPANLEQLTPASSRVANMEPRNMPHESFPG